MNLALSPKIEKLIADRIQSGRYATPEDVVAAAITTLDRQETFDTFAPGELEELLAAGEADIERGDVVDADEVFSELRRRSAERRKAGR